MSRLFVAVLCAMFGASFSSSAFAVANELDSEAKVTNVQALVKNLPGTLVIRVSEKDKSIEVAHVKASLPDNTASAKELASLQFRSVQADQKYKGSEFALNGAGELNKDQARESWYFWYGYRPAYGYGVGYGYGSFYYPSYWYAGYSYPYYPYYNYSYAGYSYYYYRPLCWW